MSNSFAVIPPDRWHEAIELLVSAADEDVRGRQQALVRAAMEAEPRQAAGLLGHIRGGALTAVTWLQHQAGRAATLWPPAATDREDPAVAAALAAEALDVAKARGAVLVQSLLLTDTGRDADTLRQAGFAHAADLLYLVSTAESFPAAPPDCELDFTPADGAARLERVIERTYEGTRDCPALDGVRAIGDVVAGYRAVGRFRPELWFIVRRGRDDVGCLLLADHSPQRVWELVYMGVAPEARGSGLGLEIARHAQWLASREGVERLVLAVDAANEPALAMYAAAGFVSWDHRSVFVWTPSLVPGRE